jgi:hypothetical protein
MGSVSVSRTLVKSPPEVWAELEREGRLAELLEIESIEITVAQELEVLEWQAEAASGRIEIKASGWGTKVSLTAEVDEAAAPVESADEPSNETVVPVLVETPVELPVELPEQESQAEDEAAASEGSGTPAGDGAAAGPPDEHDPLVDELEETSQRVARRGLWARIKDIFGADETLASESLTVEAIPDTHDEAEAVAVAPADVAGAEAEVEAEAEAEVDCEVEVLTVTETVSSVVVDDSDPAPAATPDLESRLTAVLDHLGAAHKRPFSSM